MLVELVEVEVEEVLVLVEDVEVEVVIATQRHSPPAKMQCSFVEVFMYCSPSAGLEG